MPTTAAISSSPGAMPLLFLDVWSYRDFPMGEFWSLVPGWWFVDIEDGGRLRVLDPGSEPGARLDEMCVVESGHHRAMRSLVAAKHPKHGEICVRGTDGGLVAWVDGETMMEVFRRVGELQLGAIIRSELGSITLPPPPSSSVAHRLRLAMIAWAADQHDGYVYEDSRAAFNAASRELGLPELDHLGVPAELRR